MRDMSNVIGARKMDSGNSYVLDKSAKVALRDDTKNNTEKLDLASRSQTGLSWIPEVNQAS
jgi:hypothetical protein